MGPPEAQVVRVVSAATALVSVWQGVGDAQRAPSHPICYTTVQDVAIRPVRGRGLPSAAIGVASYSGGETLMSGRADHLNMLIWLLSPLHFLGRAPVEAASPAREVRRR